MVMQRALINRTGKIRAVIEDEDGQLVDPDGQSVTVTLYDGGGTEIVSATAASREGLGEYVYTFTAPAQCDQLTAVWAYAEGGTDEQQSTTVDIVGERLVNLARLRAVTGLESLSGADLRDIAVLIEDWFEYGLGMPPMPRGKRATWRESDIVTRLRVPGVHRPLEVYALSREGTAFTLSTLSIVEDRIETTSGSNISFLTGQNTGSFAAGKYTAHVKHGIEHTPGDLRRAALKLAEHVAKSSDLPDRARRIVTMDTEVWLAFPSVDQPTGLPEVDATIERYAERAAV